MNIQLRKFQERDADLIVVLMNSADAVDHAGRSTSLEELREDYSSPGLLPEENVFVAESGEGRIIGVGTLAISNNSVESTFRARLIIHPMFRGRGLEDRMLKQLELRAGERVSEATKPRILLAAGVDSANTDSLEAFERAGLREARRFWRMERVLSDNLTPSIFLPGLETRAYRVGDDDEPVRLAFNDAFSENFGNEEETPEGFQHFVRSRRFRPDLSVVAIDRDNGQVAGFNLVVVNDRENDRMGTRNGMIDILGVLREYRRQGLGEALLLQGMRNLFAAGLNCAVLYCDSENGTGATRLYFRNGFEVKRTWILFEKEIGITPQEIQRAFTVTAN